MTNREIFDLITMWSRIAPDEDNAYVFRCREAAYANQQPDADDLAEAADKDAGREREQMLHDERWEVYLDK